MHCWTQVYGVRNRPVRRGWHSYWVIVENRTSDLSRGVAFCYNIFSGDIEVNVRDDDCFNNREDCTREDLHVEFTECDELVRIVCCVCTLVHPSRQRHSY